MAGGIFQGPSANVTIVGGGGGFAANVTSGGRLEVDSVISGGSVPILLETLTADPSYQVIAGSSQYKNLLLIIKNADQSNVANIDALLVQTPPDEIYGGLLSYFQLKAWSANSETYGFKNIINGVAYADDNTGTDANYCALLFVNTSQSDVAISYLSSNAEVDVYGLDVDLSSLVPSFAPQPVISAASSAGIRTVSIPNDGTFVSPASQVFRNVTISTVGAPGAIAFSYDGGSNYMEIPVGALYTIAGVPDLQNLSFAYVPTGSTYDLKLNWEN